MRRTTLLLEDALYDHIKALSVKKGTTIKEVLNDLLRFSLQNLVKKTPEKKICFPLHRKNGPLPGVDIADRQALYDLMEE